MHYLDSNLDAILRARCEAACEYLRPLAAPHAPMIRELAELFKVKDSNFSKYCGGSLKRPIITFENLKSAHANLRRMVRTETDEIRQKHLVHVQKLLGLAELLRRPKGDPIDFQDAKRFLAIVVGHTHPRLGLHQTFLLRRRVKMEETLARALRQIRSGDLHINEAAIAKDPHIAAFIERLPGYSHAIQAASHAIGACAVLFRSVVPPDTTVRGHLHMVARASRFDREELLSFAHSHTGEKGLQRRRPIPVTSAWYVVARAVREIAELRGAEQHTIVSDDDYTNPPRDFRGPPVLAVAASALRHQHAAWVVSFDLVRAPGAQPTSHDVRAIVTERLRWATTVDGQLRPTPVFEETLSQLHEALRHIGGTADIERMIRGVRGIIEIG